MASKTFFFFSFSHKLIDFNLKKSVENLLKMRTNVIVQFSKQIIIIWVCKNQQYVALPVQLV